MVNIDFLLLLLLPLVHRLALFIILTLTIVVTILPTISQLEKEDLFVSQVNKVMNQVLSVCFILLVFSGIARLQYGIPELIELKLFLAFITVFVNITQKPDITNTQFFYIQIVKFTLISVTAFIGVLL